MQSAQDEPQGWMGGRPLREPLGGNLMLGFPQGAPPSEHQLGATAMDGSDQKHVLAC